MGESSYSETVRTAQSEWRSWRANGVHSLKRLHQTVEVSPRLAAQFQNTIIDAMPVSSDTKSAIAAQHPPLIMGWALGPDDRSDDDAFDSKSSMRVHIPRSFSRRKTQEFMNGIMWINEVITGRASRDTIQTLQGQPIHTKVGLLSRAFLNAEFVQSEMETHTSGQTQLIQLLQNPRARTNVYNAWFSNDQAYMNQYLARSTGMNLNEFTLNAGKIQNYDTLAHEMTEKNINGGGYMMGRGIAYVQGRWPWAYTVMTAAPFVIGKYLHFDSLSGIASASIFAFLYGKLFTRLNQAAPSAFAHEMHHYLAEGENHMGWYGVSYGTRRR